MITIVTRTKTVDWFNSLKHNSARINNYVFFCESLRSPLENLRSFCLWQRTPLASLSSALSLCVVLLCEVQSSYWMALDQANEQSAKQPASQPSNQPTSRPASRPVLPSCRAEQSNELQRARRQLCHMRTFPSAAVAAAVTVAVLLLLLFASRFQLRCGKLPGGPHQHQQQQQQKQPGAA